MADRKFIEVFKFEELSEEAKQVAIEQYRNNMDFHIESEFITEDFREILQELGYPTDDLEWRLSYSQGDGVAFYGSVDMETVVPRLIKEEYDFDYELYQRVIEQGWSITTSIQRNMYGYRYSHWNTMDVEMDYDDLESIAEDLAGDIDSVEFHDTYDELNVLVTDLKYCITDDVQETSRALEREGYKHLEYYSSDEAIKENIIANEYEFTSDGKQFIY